VILFNIVVDPYLLFNVPRVAGFNDRKPGISSQQYLIKAYDVIRAHPATLILGSSSVELGIDPGSPAWPPQALPVYNLGLLASRGSPYTAYRYLQHVTASHHVGMIVLALEFQDFLTFPEQRGADYEARLSVTRDGSANRALGWQHLHDILFATTSLDATLDSLQTLWGNLSGDSLDVVAGHIDYSPSTEQLFRVGSFPIVALSDLTYSTLYRDTTTDWRALKDVRAILEICRNLGIQVIVVLDPAHADDLELLDLAGKWAALEDWKRKLTRLVSEYVDINSRRRVELWDFCGYNAYSTESVPHSPATLRWFLSPNHYTTELGDAVIRRLFGPDDGPFGVRLTPQSIEPHLAEVRRRQQRYRDFKQQDAARARELYTLASK
jgi:hypothetical protein